MDSYNYKTTHPAVLYMRLFRFYNANRCVVYIYRTIITSMLTNRIVMTISACTLGTNVKTSTVTPNRYYQSIIFSNKLFAFDLCNAVR